MTPRLIIVSAPSGAGKSTLCDRAVQEFPQLVDTITCTTRAPRPGEYNGHPYFFLSEEEFLKRRDSGAFAEWAVVHGNFYATPLEQLENAWRHNRYAIMDVDVKGAETLKGKFPEAHTIFILPPSMEELKRRLRIRDGGKTNNLELRLKNAEHEMTKVYTYDHRVINDNVDRAYGEFKKIIEEILRKG